MFESAKRKLMIVCDDKTEKYANYLMALVSQKDDTEDSIVGTKDDSVSAGVCPIKNYRDTISTISSDNNILFIGSFKEAKDLGKSINYTFNKYGMHYGWIGKRAVMYVDNEALSLDDYTAFIEFASKYLNDFENVVGDFIKTNSTISAATFITIAAPVTGILLEKQKKNKLNKQILDQQYSCLTMVFYMDALEKFLEG